jgi:hypothetical protein
VHIYILRLQALTHTTPYYRYITVQPFSVDFFEKAVAEPYPWSSTFREWGELRYNFKVTWT